MGKVGTSLLFAVALTACSRDVPAPTAPQGPRGQAEPSGKKAEAKPQLTMHRVQAGEPDGSGWYPANSTEGGFRVHLPRPFNDFTMHAKGEDGVEGKTFCVGTVTPTGTKFAALAARRLDGKLNEDPVASVVATFEKQGALKEKRPVTVAGLAGIELGVESQASGALIRVFKTQGTVYQLIVEWFPPTKLEQVQDDARRFFESLKLTQKEQD